MLTFIYIEPFLESSLWTAQNFFFIHKLCPSSLYPSLPYYIWRNYSEPSHPCNLWILFSPVTFTLIKPTSHFFNLFIAHYSRYTGNSITVWSKYVCVEGIVQSLVHKFLSGKTFLDLGFDRFFIKVKVVRKQSSSVGFVKILKISVNQIFTTYIC